ncbi:hypothetical protein HDE_09895 [Halotydeus destructor]|nr:hypothetical protein HDE_09895 [Halotydeus destructor]
MILSTCSQPSVIFFLTFATIFSIANSSNETDIDEDPLNSSLPEGNDVRHGSAQSLADSNSGHLNKSRTSRLKSTGDGKVRYCTSSADCHLDLNERCVLRTSRSVCQCREPFERNARTNSCDLKRAVKVSVDFVQLPYVAELSRKNTPAHIRTKELVESTLLAVFDNSDTLRNGVSQVRGSNFSAAPVSGGHLRTSFYLYIREPLYTQPSVDALALLLIKEISVSVHELNSSSNATANFDLQVSEMEADIDPCELAELNYCSPDATCTPDKDGGFRCECNDRFTDISPHPVYRGEQCTVECPESYCANGGHCHVDHKGVQFYCTCNNWNVGGRCQYSGIVVFSVLGLVVLLLLLIVGCAASAFCGQRAHTLRQVNYGKALGTPVYDEHVRPLRITIDNPYEVSPIGSGRLDGATKNNISFVSNDQATNDQRRLSQGHSGTPRVSVDENIGAQYSIQVTTTSTGNSPCPSPRNVRKMAANASVQTDSADNQRKSLTQLKSPTVTTESTNQGLPRIGITSDLEDTEAINEHKGHGKGGGRTVTKVTNVHHPHHLNHHHHPNGMTMGTAVTIGSNAADKVKPKNSTNGHLTPDGRQYHQSHVAYF